MKTRQIAVDAVLAAMCTALAYFSLDAGSFRISLDSLPVLVGAMLLGPFDGLAIGLVGSLVFQLIYYGISATTVLWILPYAAMGFLAGFLAQKHKFELKKTDVLGIVFLCELLATLMNTGVIYIDSHIYGWYYPELISGALVLRLAVCITLTCIFTMLIPVILKAVGNVSVRH